MAEKPGNVITALAAVMADMPGIGKGEKSAQGYSYRGIEQITAEVQPLLAKHCVVFVPRVVARFTKDFDLNSKPWTEEQLTVEYTVYGPGGADDKIVVGPVVGLGRDNSDKGANKAMTQAFKYALIQTFCIGDAKDDPDAEPAREADKLEAKPDRSNVNRVTGAIKTVPQAAAAQAKLNRRYAPPNGAAPAEPTMAARSDVRDLLKDYGALAPHQRVAVTVSMPKSTTSAVTQDEYTAMRAAVTAAAQMEETSA